MRKSQIFEALYKQNSIDKMICLTEIKTEEDKKEANEDNYIIPYTASEWEQTYPSIPVKNIYYTQSYLYAADPFYIDIDHYIMFHTHLYGTEFLNPTNKNFETIMHEIINAKMTAYKEKNYLDLLQSELSESNGNLVLYLLNLMLEKEPPSDNLYQVFVDVYSYVDNGTPILSEETWYDLLQCKSEKQKEKTRKALEKYPDEIIVYRGEGSQSTPHEKAFSWTTNKQVAYFFATKNGAEKARLITGKIKKDDILETISDRDEDEIIIKSEFVKIMDVHNFVTLDNFFRCLQKEMSNYVTCCDMSLLQINVLIQKIKILYEYHHDSENDDHTMDHTIRVMMYANYLFRKIILPKYEKTNKQKKMQIMSYFFDLMDAAIYHDIGRTNDFIDENHGKESYKIYKKEKKENSIVKFLIEQHCINDGISLEILKKEFHEEQDIIGLLYKILKDADALDRTRFGRCEDGLNIDYLRFDESRDIVPIAHAMLEYKL